MTGNRRCCGGSCGGGGPLTVGTVEGARPEGGPAVPAGSGVALTTLKAGQTATVHGTTLEHNDAALLRAMGLRPSAMVRVCRLGEPCIIEVLGGVRAENGCAERNGACICRIGLARPLAERVMVGPVE